MVWHVYILNKISNINLSVNCLSPHPNNSGSFLFFSPSKATSEPTVLFKARGNYLPHRCSSLRPDRSEPPRPPTRGYGGSGDAALPMGGGPPTPHRGHVVPGGGPSAFPSPHRTRSAPARPPTGTRRAIRVWGAERRRRGTQRPLSAGGPLWVRPYGTPMGPPTPMGFPPQ